MKIIMEQGFVILLSIVATLGSQAVFHSNISTSSLRGTKQSHALRHAELVSASPGLHQPQLDHVLVLRYGGRAQQRDG